jgi:uncharacterized Zn-binding protein involved in type VI secretion
MPQVHRKDDRNTAGAPIIKVRQSRVYANNRLVSVDGSNVQRHGPGKHAGPVTANGSRNVFIERIPVNFRGNADSCGHPRAAGSQNVFVNGA